MPSFQGVDPGEPYSGYQTLPPFSAIALHKVVKGRGLGPRPQWIVFAPPC